MLKKFHKSTKQNRVIGIDPGYERVGVAVVEKNARGKETLIYSDCIHTDKRLSHPERLKIIAKNLEMQIKKHRPDILAAETLFFESNQKTAMRVAEARGVILVTGILLGLTVREFTPLQIKMAVTGDGRADKKQIISMIPRLIQVPKKKMLDDEYDAIATALTCLAIHKNQ
jgi:crossover junction endodeoxyribonuclease RuvC